MKALNQLLTFDRLSKQNIAAREREIFYWSSTSKVFGGSGLNRRGYIFIIECQNQSFTFTKLQKMDLDQAKKIFESLIQDDQKVIATDGFVDSIRNSAIDYKQNIEQIILWFDPTDCGYITFDDFQRGIEKIYQQNESTTSLMFSDSPVDCGQNTNRSAEPILGQSIFDQDGSLSSFHPTQPLISSNSALTTTPPEGLLSKYSDDLTALDCLSPITGFTNNISAPISVVLTNPNNDQLQLGQMEEHFEFTPSPESLPEIKKNELDADEDYSYSNGGDSYNSIKSAQFPQRNTWLRSSVRRNGKNSSLSPYTSRRSSLSYESDEMNNDANLEEDVLNLNDKIKKLQEQIEILSEAQTKNEIKYTSMKKENINLNDKISFLEEQVRDIELQSDEKKKDDERRFKDSMARFERDKSQELQAYIDRIFALQKELFESKEEIKEQLLNIENLYEAKSDLQNQVQDKESEIELLKDELAQRDEIIRQQEEVNRANSKIIDALNRELMKHNSSDIQQIEHKNQKERENEMNDINVELESQLRMLKEENRSLKDANEELTAQLLNNHLIEGKSLLREGEAISSLANEISDLNNEQLKTALKEQQDVNAKLRAYIDGILLNIVENYPQLLEVKRV